MNVLVIVDVQEEYYKLSTNKLKVRWTEFITNIISKINDFKNKNLPIVILNHIIGGALDENILNAIKGYDNLYFLMKKGYDGSRSLDNLFKKRNINDGILITGLYTGCCIYKTARSMYNKGYNIFVSPNTCLDGDFYERDFTSIGVNVI